MEQRQMLWMLITALGISLVIIAGSLTASARRTPDRPAVEHPATSAVTTAPGYVLRIDGDALCLYRSGCDTPYQRLDMPLSLLSDYDRQQLTQGITVQTQAEARQLVEDYTS